MTPVVHPMPQQDLANLLARKKCTIEGIDQHGLLTGRTAESGGVSIMLFVEEDCCQAEQLVEVDVPVSFGIMPRVLFRTKYSKRQKLS